MKMMDLILDNLDKSVAVQERINKLIERLERGKPDNNNSEELRGPVASSSDSVTN